jgi:hypothetical protein
MLQTNCLENKFPGLASREFLNANREQTKLAQIREFGPTCVNLVCGIRRCHEASLINRSTEGKRRRQIGYTLQRRDFRRECDAPSLRHRPRGPLTSAARQTSP